MKIQLINRRLAGEREERWEQSSSGRRAGKGALTKYNTETKGTAGTFISLLNFILGKVSK